MPIAYFSDYFGVDPEVIDTYGAFNVSIINDLPLFIDPFLLFNSKKEEYQQLHEEIIGYLRFLREKSLYGGLNDAAISAWYKFPEVKQNWFGFSLEGNSGRGLGATFAQSLYENLHRVFADFGDESITKGSHLEKLCLFSDGVGRDNISDFATNLIKDFLLNYTQTFAKKAIHESLRRRIRVPRVRFNYKTETWESDTFDLPYVEEYGDFVLLTPKDILTKDETWINRPDLFDQFEDITFSIPNDELRFQINNYLAKVLPDSPDSKERKGAYSKTILEFPEILDYYIRYKEDNGDRAFDMSQAKVRSSSELYVNQFNQLITALHNNTNFYNLTGNSFTEAMDRVKFLKDVIENQDGYKWLWKNGKPISNERDTQLLYRLTWYASSFDVNREVNNGRGPVDFKISKGSADTTLVEFKLAKNTKLKQNLENQVEIYKKANNTASAITVIFHFTYDELKKVTAVLTELDLLDNKNIVLIDAREDNKPSASAAREH